MASIIALSATSIIAVIIVYIRSLKSKKER
jgi:hypothetical protein